MHLSAVGRMLLNLLSEYNGKINFDSFRNVISSIYFIILYMLVFGYGVCIKTIRLFWLFLRIIIDTIKVMNNLTSELTHKINDYTKNANSTIDKSNIHFQFFFISLSLNKII
jgi:hypothetical protein